MRVLGIDPGLSSGAAAVVDAAAVPLSNMPLELIDAIDLPTTGDDAKKRIDVVPFRDWILVHRPTHAVIERAQTMPNQGIASAGKYMRATGMIEATVLVLDIPLFTVESRAWKKRFELGGKAQHDFSLASEAQDDARLKALEVYGQSPCAAQLFKLIKHHNRAEAALIAGYGAENLLRAQAQRG